MPGNAKRVHSLQKSRASQPLYSTQNDNLYALKTNSKTVNMSVKSAAFFHQSVEMDAP